MNKTVRRLLYLLGFFMLVIISICLVSAQAEVESSEGKVAFWQAFSRLCGPIMIWGLGTVGIIAGTAGALWMLITWR